MPKKPDLTDEDQAMRERLGAALRLASSSRGIKPADMAVAGGVSLAHQYRIEAGERTPDALYLFKVCLLLGVTMDSLFTGGTAASAPSTSLPTGSQIGDQRVIQTSRGSRSVQVHGSKNKISTKGA